MTSTLVADLRIRLGGFETQGRLLSLRAKDDKPETHYCTPDGERVLRRWLDPQGEIWEESDLERLVEDGDESVVVSREERDKKRDEGLVKNILNLTVHPADQIKDSLFPSAHQAYCFEPGRRKPKGPWERDWDPRNEHHFDTILEAVADEQYWFCGTAKMSQSNFALYRASIFDDQLLIQRMLFPDQLEHHAITHGTIGDREKQILSQLLDSMVTPFEADTYQDVAADRLRELVGTNPTAPTAIPDHDLASEMERMLRDMEITRG